MSDFVHVVDANVKLLDATTPPGFVFDHTSDTERTAQPKAPALAFIKPGQSRLFFVPCAKGTPYGNYNNTNDKGRSVFFSERAASHTKNATKPPFCVTLILKHKKGP